MAWKPGAQPAMRERIVPALCSSTSTCTRGPESIVIYNKESRVMCAMVPSFRRHRI